jgi:hypothetical protein
VPKIPPPIMATSYFDITQLQNLYINWFWMIKKGNEKHDQGEAWI